MSEKKQNKPVYVDIFGEKLQIVAEGEFGRDLFDTVSRCNQDGDRAEIICYEGKLIEYKIFRKDGSIEHYDSQNTKYREKNKDGVEISYSNGKKELEEFPDGSVIIYFDDESIKYQRNADDSFVKYYEKDKIKEKGDKSSFYSYSPEGKLQYKIENRKLWIDPEYYSFVRIGMKTRKNEEHWTEDFELDPQKKTIICYGGDATHTPQGGNGNINAFVRSLGFSPEQKDSMQMLAHYCPQNRELMRNIRRYKAANYKELYQKDYLKETLKVYMPFIAKKTAHGWEKLPAEELLDNMRNILNTTHCYGTNEMVDVSAALYEQMPKLGYEPSLINQALKQNLCITNNSRRDFCDDIKMTILHRYSVCDGPGETMYDEDYTNAYPTYLDKKEDFSKIKGDKSAFINLNKSEVLMVFDKILSVVCTNYSQTEHNQAFFEDRKDQFTAVGYQQMKLIKAVAQFWYNNHDAMPNAADLLRKCAEIAGVETFVEKSFIAGKKLQKEHTNPLKNPHVFKVAKNRFNNPDIEPEHTGVWKLLDSLKQQTK